MDLKEKELTITTGAGKTHLLSRQPLSAFDKLAVAGFLGGAVSSSILALTLGLPYNAALLIVTAVLAIGAGLAAIGWRWMPLLITLLSGVFLYQLTRIPYVTYHLSNPQGEGGFLFFAFDFLLVVGVAVTFGASIGAAVQNYRRSERTTPSWLRAAMAGVVGIVVGALLIGAIAQPVATTASTAYTNGVPTVHMNAANFTQPSVTIAKGSKLLLVDDVSVTHILANGSWQNGMPKTTTEPGAPLVSNVQINGTSTEIGPFTTAGTYHIYCIVHQGMNLTVIVQ